MHPRRFRLAQAGGPEGGSTVQRPLWRIGGALALALTVFCGAAPGWAQDAKDPDAVLKEINTWYTDQIRKAQEAKTQPDFRALMTERTERTKTALKDFDPEKVEPGKALALAQLYQIVQDNPRMITSAKRFLTTNPEGAGKFSAQQLLLTGYAATNDADGLIATLGEIKTPDGRNAASLASATAGRYAAIVAEKKGAQAGLDLITKMEAAVPFAELLAKPDVTDREGKPAPAPEKMTAEIAIMQIAQGRSALLEKAGKKDEALSALQTGIEKLPKGSRYAKSLESKIKLAKIVGTPAPALKVDRGYGGFKSLDDYKGKVVVVEFTAHW
jgi:hypothetical protein